MGLTVMDPERTKAMAEVDQMIEDKVITCFEDVRKVIKHPPTKGEYRAGEEFEGELRPGEKSWELPEDIALFEADAKDEFNDPTTCTTALVAFEPGDAVIEWSEANLVAKKLQRLRRLRAEAAAMMLKPATYSISREIVNLESARVKKGPSAVPNAIVSRMLRQEAAATKVIQNANAATARKKRAHKARLALVAARIKRAKELMKLAKERDEEKLLGITVKYPSALCGNKKNWKGHTGA